MTSGKKEAAGDSSPGPATLSGRSDVNIREPGPDFGGFPNSPAVLPLGRLYLETAVSLTSSDNLRDLDILRVPDVTVPSLLRVGVARDWEVRMFGSLINREGEEDNRTTTSGPYGVGFRYHVREAASQPHRPAFGVEWQAVLPIGSTDITAGHVLTNGSLNFKHDFPRNFSVPWNIGYGTSVDSNGDSFVQADLQWSLANDVSRNVQLYLTSASNYPASNSSGGTASTLGIGALWWTSDRAALQFLYSWGLNSNSADANASLIASFAF